jgi:hypothetical protein
MTRLPFMDVGLGVLAAVTAGAVTLAVTHKTTDKAAAAKPIVVPSASTIPPVAADFLADELYAKDAQSGYPALLSGATGWSVHTHTVARDGYLGSGGAASGTGAFAGKISAVAADNPGVVIVVGGVSQQSLTPASAAAIGAAATDLYAKLKAAMPQIRLVVVGPLLPGVSAAALSPVEGALRAATLGAGVRYLSPVSEGWLTGVQANPAGASSSTQSLATSLRIADHLRDDLRKLNFQVGGAS